VAKANALTAIFVKQCNKPGVYRDGQGLLLRVAPSGAGRWVLRVSVRTPGHRAGISSERFMTTESNDLTVSINHERMPARCRRPGRREWRAVRASSGAAPPQDGRSCEGVGPYVLGRR
jgi:hypothetical protein